MTGPEREITTARLRVRPPREADRARFTELFCDPAFMVYYWPDALTPEQGNRHFDHMLAVCQAIPFGKQPIVERSSGVILGYTGVDYIDLDGRTWLEWGYRLIPESAAVVTPLRPARLCWPRPAPITPASCWP